MKNFRWTFVLCVSLFAASSTARAGDQYNFLWVIDNNSSMGSQTKLMADNFATFTSQLSAKHPIRYKMAVTTTDYFTTQGALVAAPSGKTVVDSQSANPGADFAAIVGAVADDSTSFWHQGLESSLQAVQKNGADFVQDGIPLVIVYVTNDEDYSCAGNCYGVEPVHNTGWLEFPVARYSMAFQQMQQKRGIQVSVFPMVGTSDSTCFIDAFGYRYLVAQPPGGFGLAANICENQFVKGFLKIAATISNQP